MQTPGTPWQVIEFSSGDECSFLPRTRHGIVVFSVRETLAPGRAGDTMIMFLGLFLGGGFNTCFSFKLIYLFGEMIMIHFDECFSHGLKTPPSILLQLSLQYRLYWCYIYFASRRCTNWFKRKLISFVFGQESLSWPY